MRILVFSDSHGAGGQVARLAAENPGAEEVFFLGDGAGDLYAFSGANPAAKIHRVSGNCDPGGLALAEDTVELAGARIFLCHGHTLGVKSGLEALYRRAAQAGASLVLYGHTHVPDISYFGGAVFVNPGSLGRPPLGRRPTYAVVDIGDGTPRARIVAL